MKRLMPWLVTWLMMASCEQFLFHPNEVRPNETALNSYNSDTSCGYIQYRNRHPHCIAQNNKEKLRSSIKQGLVKICLLFIE